MEVDRSRWELKLDEWHQPCQPEAFSFRTTADTGTEVGILGQKRAKDALDFGLAIPSHGFNVMLVGARASGRHDLALSTARALASSRSTPDDWCFVHSFLAPDAPNALRLPAGRGREFQRDMSELVAATKQALAQAFDSDAYREQAAQITDRLGNERDRLLGELTRVATENGYALRPTPMGMASIAVVEGRPLSREEFNALPEPQQREIEERGQRVQAAIDDTFTLLHNLEREVHEALKQLNRELVRHHVELQVAPLREKYAQLDEIPAHLDHVAEQMADDADLLREAQQQEAPVPPGIPPEMLPSALDRYQVNLLVSHEPGTGAPVVVEENPTYYNLLGGVDFRSQLGAMVTDYTMVKPGSLHRANGGFLVLNAEDVLINPLVWPALKRTLRRRESRIENAADQFRVVPTPTLRPEPIPLNVKVVLVCEPRLFYLLHALDVEARDLFKVKAEFDPEMERRDSDLEIYAAFCRQRCDAEGLLPLDVCAVARLVDHGSRLRGDRRKISTQFGFLADVIREAHYWATQSSAEVILPEHVEQAIQQREERAGLPREKLVERIRDGLLLIDVEGGVIGQVNGLSVMSLGDATLGRPSRITARTAFGSRGIIDIERETELSGPIHSKGVLIMGGYLSGTFGQRGPLSLSATLTFEQAYEGVDGDSASSAELYVLLSSLADAPIDQGVAVTGSVNQLGRAQPVGGVTEKVEGFFAACQAKGLTGKQGVMLPASNARHLVLNAEVTAAIRAGRFHLWTVQSIEEGIELLTGLPAGEADGEGRFPPETLFGRVQAKLDRYAEQLRRFGPSERREQD